METPSDVVQLIWNIIISAGNITLSWGIDLETLKHDENSIRFHVQGFLHTGTVEVKYNQGADLFDISLFDENGHLTKKVEGIYSDQLVDVIDRHIEDDHSSDYDSKVEDYLREQSIAEIIIFT